MLRHSITGVAATLASGILFYFGAGLHPIWHLAWLAPIPVLLFASGASAWAAFVAALLAFLLGNTNMFIYARDTIGLPLSILVPILAIPSATFGIAVLLWRFCLRRGALWQAVLAFPCAWLAYEFLNASTSPHGTFGSLSYSQMDCLPLLQVAALTGLWGIVFTILLASATASVLLLPGGQKPKTGLGLCVATMLAAVLGCGEWRLHSDVHSTGTLKVALIGSDAEADHWAKDDQDALAILQRYTTHIESAQGAQVMVLPEDLGPISPPAAKAAIQILSAAAQRTGAEVVAGLRVGRRPPILNEALVFAPSGELEARYEKHHLIPGLENGIVAGSSITSLPASTGVEGVQICKDLDFPKLSRDYGARDVGLLLVPAFDFDVDGWLHARMAMMRGVESGFSIARAARNGLLTASDNRGRVLPSAPRCACGRRRTSRSARLRFGSWSGGRIRELLVGDGELGEMEGAEGHLADGSFAIGGERFVAHPLDWVALTVASDGATLVQGAPLFGEGLVSPASNTGLPGTNDVPWRAEDVGRRLLGESVQHLSGPPQVWINRDLLKTVEQEVYSSLSWRFPARACREQDSIGIRDYCLRPAAGSPVPTIATRSIAWPN